MVKQGVSCRVRSDVLSSVIVSSGGISARVDCPRFPTLGRQNMGSLFDPGFTSAGPNVRMRTGLFASYNILQRHRGTIEVESELGRGTVFTLWIPDDLQLLAAQSSGGGSA